MTQYAIKIKSYVNLSRRTTKVYSSSFLFAENELALAKSIANELKERANPAHTTIELVSVEQKISVEE